MPTSRYFARGDFHAFHAYTTLSTNMVQTIEIPSWMRLAIINLFCFVWTAESHSQSNGTMSLERCHFAFLFCPILCAAQQKPNEGFSKRFWRETKILSLRFIHSPTFRLSTSFSSFENIFQVKRMEMKRKSKNCETLNRFFRCLGSTALRITDFHWC